jgi:hypothetical protein
MPPVSTVINVHGTQISGNIVESQCIVLRLSDLDNFVANGWSIFTSKGLKKISETRPERDLTEAWRRLAENWRKPDKSLKEAWKRPDGNRKETWRKPEGSLTEAWKRPDGSLREAWQKPDGSLKETWRKPEGGLAEEVWRRILRITLQGFAGRWCRITAQCQDRRKVIFKAFVGLST